MVWSLDAKLQFIDLQEESASDRALREKCDALRREQKHTKDMMRRQEVGAYKATSAPMSMYASLSSTAIAKLCGRLDTQRYHEHTHVHTRLVYAYDDLCLRHPHTLPKRPRDTHTHTHTHTHARTPTLG